MSCSTWHVVLIRRPCKCARAHALARGRSRRGSRCKASGNKASNRGAPFSACDTSIRGQDIERALAVCDDDSADVAPQKCKAVKRTSIFGCRHNNKENKEPAPHTEPQTKWVTCAGTCQGKFDWSVGSQQVLPKQDAPAILRCLRNPAQQQAQTTLEYGHVICEDAAQKTPPVG